MSALDIELGIGGYASIQRAIDADVRAFRRLDKAQREAAGSRAGMGGAASGSGGGGAAGGRIPPKYPAFLGGPNQRLARARQNYALAMQHGNAAQRADAKLALDRAQPKGAGAKALDALMTSRVGFGKGGVQLMPLVNRLVPLMGRFAPAVGAATLAASGVAAALYGLKTVTEAAANTIGGRRGAQFAAGGTAAEMAKLTTLAGALGMSPGDAAGAANQFLSRITTDPLAMGRAQAAGIHAMPGPYGDIDSARVFLQAAAAIRAAPNDAAAKRFADQTGSESLLGLRDLSNDTYARLMERVKAEQEMFSPERVRAAANFNAQLADTKLAFENAFSALGGAAQGPMAWLLKKQADHYDWVSWNLRGRPQGDSGKDPHTKAVEENTQALRENTQGNTPGRYGGGNRTAGAIPAGWSGAFAKQRDFEAEARRAGSIL